VPSLSSFPSPSRCNGTARRTRHSPQILWDALKNKSTQQHLHTRKRKAGRTGKGFLTLAVVLQEQHGALAADAAHRVAVLDVAHHQLLPVEGVRGGMVHLPGAQEPWTMNPGITTMSNETHTCTIRLP